MLCGRRHAGERQGESDREEGEREREREGEIVWRSGD